MALNQFPRRSFVGSSTLQTFTGNGTQTAFTLSSAQTQNEVFLFVDDVAQVPGVDFTVSGTTLTFTSAPTNGAEIIARGFGVPAPVTTVSDGSVTSAKLATGAIEAKLGYTPVSPTQLSNEVAALVDSAPTALNTLNELAAALGDDANYATTITNALATKANTSSLGTLASVSPTGTPDNTKFLRGDNSWQVVAVTPTAVSDQNNTSTGYFDLPSGNTSQRPGSASSGNFRYNTEVGAPEYYNGTTWLSLGTLDGSTENRAAPSALYLKNTVGLTTSGVYWIKNSLMTQPVQVYCDLSYDGGGYMLLAYGYVASTNDSSSNKAIPNLNHDGTAWSYTPGSRASSNGLVLSPSSQKSALLLAKASTTMIMAAGSNPSSGGIDGYSYVYRFPIPDPAALTFNNHSYYYNSSMTNVAVTVTGLKGDTGTWSRYTIKEAIGASWGDSYPTGYGCIESSTPKNGTWDYGPFFPSIHSGSRNIAPSNPTVVSSSPDIGVNGYTAGAQSYTYRGWYGAGIGVNQTGQTSIWVK